MLTAILKAASYVFWSVPGCIAATYALIQAGEKTGFDKVKPEHHQKLVNLNNALLWLLVEHWLWLIFGSVLLGTFWAFLVVEPKVASKRQFEKRRRDKGQR